MNNLKRKSNLIVALFAFANIVVGFAFTISNSIKSAEMMDRYISERMMQQQLTSSIVSLVVNNLPVFLFVIYALFLYKKKKNHPLLMASFAILIAMSLLGIFSSVSTMIAMKQYIGFINSPYTQEEMLQMYVPLMIVNAVKMVIYIFFLVDTSKGFKFKNVSKIFSVILAAALLATPIISLSIEEKFYSSSINQYVETAMEEAANTEPFMMVLVPALLAVAFLVFWWVSVPNNSEKLSKSDLESLKKKFESGKIDEQTYQKKRAEILEKI